MKPEDQVVSIELSKKLKELRVSQDSLFWYLPMYDGSHHILFYKDLTHTTDHYIPAFTSYELLRLLPIYVTTKYDEPFCNYRFCMSRFVMAQQDKEKELIMIPTFIANYECDSTETTGENAFLFRKLFKSIYDENLADCLAKLLIKLIEEGLIK